MLRTKCFINDFSLVAADTLEDGKYFFKTLYTCFVFADLFIWIEFAKQLSIDNFAQSSVCYLFARF